MHEHDRLRFEGRWVVDVASPLGAQYLHDNSGDELAHHAKEAVGALLNERPHDWPSGGPVGRALWGGSGGSPSLVWHAQAVGALLEMGYAPTADCIRAHLRVIAGRLDPENCRGYETASDDDPWLLRTRHTAWVLACLAELPADALRTGTSNDIDEAIEEHRRLTLTAYGYLDGESEPGGWIGIQPGEKFWSEYDGQRRRNLINTIYAAIAVSRAERHGFSITRRRWHARPRLDQAIFDLADQIEIVPTLNRGPRARLTFEGWPEPWAHDDELPVGIVGLLCIFLNEYAHLLGTVDGERAALQRWWLAERLGHELLSRRAEWASCVDAFSESGAEAGWWFVHSFSVCARAVLDVGVATIRHPSVVAAFETIAQLEHTFGGVRTWSDPTMEWMGALEHSQTGHRALDVLADRAASVAPPTAASVHAAVMAYSSLRRASFFIDPRRILDRTPDNPRPPSPFTAARFTVDDRGLVMLLEIGTDYVESARANIGTFWLLRAMQGLGAPASNEEIAAEVDRIAPSVQARVTRTISSVGQHFDDLNRRFGVRLIEREPDGRAGLTLRIEESPDLDTLIEAS